MKRIITFNVLFLVLLFPFSIPSSSGKNNEIKAIKEEIRLLRDSVDVLSKKVDAGNTSLSIAKDYSDKADKLHDNFFSRFDVLINCIAIGFFAFLVGLFAYLQTFVVNRIKALFDNQTTKIVHKYDNQFRQFLDKKSIENEQTITRMVSSENIAIHLKQNSFILFIHKTNTFSENTDFGQLQRAIFSEFKNEKQTYSPAISDIAKNRDFNKLVDSVFPFKLVVMDDKLFDDLQTSNSETPYKKQFTEEGENNIVEFVNLLTSKNTGLVIFGNTILPKKPTYYAFANNPYSLYSNLNNLLKYMYVVQSSSS